MWRFSDRGVLREGYPAAFELMFGQMGVDKIDAAFERTTDGKIVFFSGMRD